MTQTLYLPGTSGNYISCPDASALDITGDIDLRINCALDNWYGAGGGTASTYQSFISKYNTTGNLRSYWFFLEQGAGTLNLILSSDGVSGTTATSSVANGLTNGTTKWVRCTWQKSSGNVNFYSSNDGSTWTQLGTTISSGFTSSIFVGTAPLEIGSNSIGIRQLVGRIYEAQVYNGIAGTLVANPKFNVMQAVYPSNIITQDLYAANGTYYNVDGTIGSNTLGFTQAHSGSVSMVGTAVENISAVDTVYNLINLPAVAGETITAVNIESQSAIFNAIASLIESGITIEVAGINDSALTNLVIPSIVTEIANISESASSTLSIPALIQHQDSTALTSTASLLVIPTDIVIGTENFSATTTLNIQGITKEVASLGLTEVSSLNISSKEIQVASQLMTAATILTISAKDIEEAGLTLAAQSLLYIQPYIDVLGLVQLIYNSNQEIDAMNIAYGGIGLNGLAGLYAYGFSSPVITYIADVVLSVLGQSLPRYSWVSGSVIIITPNTGSIATIFDSPLVSSSTISIIG